MVDKILSLYEPVITKLPWVERYGGLTTIFKRQNEDNVEIFPICMNVNPSDMEYKLMDLVPDAQYTSVCYYEQLSNIQTGRLNASGGRSSIIYSTNVRFVAWINAPKLGLDDINNSALLFPSVRKALTEKVTITDDHVLKGIIRISPKVSNVILEAKETTKNNVFGKYSYPDEMVMFYPYDYFSATFDIEWVISEKCLAENQFLDPVTCVNLNVV